MKDALTETALRNGEDGFRRTALLIKPGSDNSGSIDVIARDGTPQGRFVGRINIFVTENGTWMVDVVDVAKQYAPARALVFGDGQHPGRQTRASVEGGWLVGAHFAAKEPKR